MPTEPTPTPWQLPDPATAGERELLGIGADLEPGTLLAAYRAGLFPMPLRSRVGWWSPPRRGILPLHGLRVSRSMRRSMRRFDIGVDTAFADVLAGCAEPRSGGGGWINPPMRQAYLRLHELGWAHSVEAWDGDGKLAGGLYGIAVGGLFAGESMFHRATDASKVALAALVELLGPQRVDAADRLVDTQWLTPHLASLGCVEVDRAEYQRRLRTALTLPLPPAFC